MWLNAVWLEGGRGMLLENVPTGHGLPLSPSALGIRLPGNRKPAHGGRHVHVKNGVQSGPVPEGTRS